MSAASAVHGVVVGVDGSESSLSAVRWAVREAQLRHVGLTLVHVDEESETDAQADKVLDDAAAAAYETSGSEIPAVDHRRAHGRPVTELLAVSTAAQVLVVGTRGGTGQLRGRLGSVGVGLLHRADCPVAVVHGDLPPERRPVLVGIDRSKTSLRAAAVAFDEASLRATNLLALHVCMDADTAATHTTRIPLAEQEAEEALRDSLAALVQRYPEVAVHYLVRFRHPARQLLVQAERAQLVVVGSHGRGAVSGKLLGSVSTKVVEESRVPVVVVR